jgi:hypothetical protein
MIKRASIVLAALVFTLVLSSCFARLFADKPAARRSVAPAQGYGNVESLPFREAWYGMYFHEDKVGYSHFKIEPSGRNFSISRDSLLRLTAMKRTNEISLKEKAVVRADLTLISFDSKVQMDGKGLRVAGRVEGNRFVVGITAEGETLNRELSLDGDLFHTSSITLIPVLRGLKDGGAYSFRVFNPEKQAIEEVSQQVSKVAGDPGPHAAVWKVKNLYGRAEIQSWLDASGLTVLERTLEGALTTMLEDEQTAKDLLSKGRKEKDLILDLSLIRVSKPIPHPEKTRYLRVRMSGVANSTIPNDHRQKVSSPNGGAGDHGFEIAVTVEDIGALGKGGQSVAPESAKKNLESTPAIQSDHAEIVAQARKIVAPSDSPMAKATKLVQWTAKNVKNRMKDSFTALSVLRSLEGECQSHAGLYTAMARSLELPTRVVTGLVYTEDVGFLYHAWAESFVGGWLAVDPTLNQIPADATHIKITTGDVSDDPATLVRIVGKVKLDLLEFK